MITTTIRPVKLTDVDNLLPLFAQLGYPTSAKILTSRIERFLQNPGYGAAVYQQGDCIAGWIAWSKQDLFVKDAVRFHIEGIVVTDQLKGKGIGKQLMQFVEIMAENNRPAIIDLTTSLQRAPEGVHEFYNRLGYVNEGLTEKLYLRKEF